MSFTKPLFIVLLSLYSLSVQAQQTAKIYFNKDWKEIPAGDTATYYREYFPGKELIWVKDYYINGHLQMSGAITPGDSFRTGAYAYYYESGVLEIESNYQKGKREGAYSAYHPNGTLYWKGNYKEDYISGTVHRYDSIGKLFAKEYYIEDPERVRYILHHDTAWSHLSEDEIGGMKEGKNYYYHPGGTIASEELFQDGKFISANFFDPDGRVVYYNHDAKSTMSHPRFNGGDYVSYLNRNLRYPKEARKKGITGRVLVWFVIETDGSISELRVAKAAHPLLDQAAMDVIRATSGMWQPGKVHNLPFRASYTAPINFKLQ